MKDNLNRCVCLVVCLLGLSFLTSCGGGSTSTPSGPLVPPSNIKVIRVAEGLRVSWSGVPGAKYYQLQRKDGAGSFALIPNHSFKINNTSWTDNSYPKDKTVQYAVIALNQTEMSTLSEPTSPISEQVQDISVTKMQFTDRIELQWSVHPENPDNYKIYRKSASNTDPVFLTETTGNFYLDTTAPLGEIQYYRITWVKEGLEYGDDIGLVYGVRGTVCDVFEANDEPDQSALLIKENSNTAYTYALSDHFTGSQIDTDWYQYQKTGTDPETLVVIVSLPEDSPFLGKLRLQFYEADSPIGTGNILYDTENLCDYNLQATTTNISFKVEPVGITGTEGIGSYTMVLQ